MKRLTEQFAVETDRFEHREVKPHFINPCCFGEDFAAWLKQELAQLPDLGMALSDPIQEDYGWGIWASRDKDRFWIALSCVDEEPQEGPAEWIISVGYDPGLNLVTHLFHKPDERAFRRVRDGIEQILRSDGTIRLIEP